MTYNNTLQLSRNRFIDYLLKYFNQCYIPRMNEYLITALKDAGLQQNELAELLGVSANMVCQWAKSHRPVSIEQAVKIELVTDGKIQAGRLAPDFFALLGKIGYTQAIDTHDPSPD